MNRCLTYLTNDYGWAIYDSHTKERLAWGQFGSDLFFAFRDLAKALGNNRLEAGGTMPPFDGDEPCRRLC